MRPILMAFETACCETPMERANSVGESRKGWTVTTPFSQLIQPAQPYFFKGLLAKNQAAAARGWSQWPEGPVTGGKESSRAGFECGLEGPTRGQQASPIALQRAQLSHYHDLIS